MVKAIPFLIIFSSMSNKSGGVPYKAAIVRLMGDGEADEIHVFVQLRDGSILDRSIGMTDHHGDYNHLGESDIGLAWLFVDDIDENPIVLEHVLEHNPEFEDISFRMDDVKVATVASDTEESLTVMKLIMDDRLGDVLVTLFEDELEGEDDLIRLN